MNSILPALLGVLQPPYAWILLLLIALPFWVLYIGVFVRRVEYPLERAEAASRKLLAGTSELAERDLGRYAALLTSVWLLLVAFKVYQQYFAANPLPHTQLGAFDFALGLFSLASWMGLILLHTQEQV